MRRALKNVGVFFKDLYHLIFNLNSDYYSKIKNNNNNKNTFTYYQDSIRMVL